MKVKPSSIDITVYAQPSKSFMQRALVASLLAPGISEIYNPSFCDDTMAVMNIIKNLGADIDDRDHREYIFNHDREKNKIKITGGGTPKERLLECGESGLAIRMLTPVAGLFEKEFLLNASASLKKRPVKMIEAPMMALGAQCRTDEGFPPVIVRGPLRGGDVEIDGSVSSQFLTGLLMALPLCDRASNLSVLNLKSKPYVKMTVSLLKHYGIRVDSDEELEKFHIQGHQIYSPSEYAIEGDWSGSSFILVAGALAGKVQVLDLSSDTMQPDAAIMEVLSEVGAKIDITEQKVSVMKNELKAFKFDATDCPDLFPPLVSLACNCRGKSIIHGVSRLKHKESDRAKALVSEFSKLGAEISIFNNTMEITGKGLKGGEIDSHGDHRIAMACAVAALNSNSGITINNWQCVNKSYPNFFNDLKGLYE